MNLDTETLLPQTAEELETFIEVLTKEFNLPPGDETAYSITSMIVHLPATQAYARPAFFAHGVQRGIAQKHAYTKNQEVTARLNAAIEAEKKAKEETSKLTLVENGTSSTDGQQPLQGA